MSLRLFGLPTLNTSVTSCFGSFGSVRNYPGGRLKAIKRRRKTVGTIGKITNTMKVVASSKLPAAQSKAAAVSPFFQSIYRTFDFLQNQPKEGQKVLTLVICTDKGLCGSTNNGLTRTLLKENLSNDSIVIWGDKGVGAFERSVYKPNVIFSAHPNQKTILSFIEISTVVDKLMQYDFDVLRIAYNKMVTVSTPGIDYLYVPTFKTLSTPEAIDKFSNYEIEATNSEEILQSLAEYSLSAAINYACFHNQNVELFARRNSMDNASKNAKEVGTKLTIKFNRERQAIITTELGEITSGAAAVDEMTKK